MNQSDFDMHHLDLPSRAATPENVSPELRALATELPMTPMQLPPVGGKRVPDAPRKMPPGKGARRLSEYAESELEMRAREVAIEALECALDRLRGDGFKPRAAVTSTTTTGKGAKRGKKRAKPECSVAEFAMVLAMCSRDKLTDAIEVHRQVTGAKVEGGLSLGAFEKWVRTKLFDEDGDFDDARCVSLASEMQESTKCKPKESLQRLFRLQSAKKQPQYRMKDVVAMMQLVPTCLDELDLSEARQLFQTKMSSDTVNRHFFNTGVSELVADKLFSVKLFGEQTSAVQLVLEEHSERRSVAKKSRKTMGQALSSSSEDESSEDDE